MAYNIKYCHPVLKDVHCMRRYNKWQLMKYSNIKRVDNYLFQYTEDFSFCIKKIPEFVTYDIILSRCNEMGSD